MSNIITQIGENVAKRGYHDLPLEPLVCRHVAKLVEELGEIAENTSSDTWSNRWKWWLAHAAENAREIFDCKDIWEHYWIVDEDKLKAEMTDLFVVLSSMSYAMGFDIEGAALEKSQNDIERGVRNGNNDN